MLTVEESSFEDDSGEVNFVRVWKHSSGREWRIVFAWDNLEKAAWIPPCEDFDGILLFCEGF